MKALSLIFFLEFQKTLRITILKVNLPVDVPYLIKEHVWISTTDEATRKKCFGGLKRSSKLTLKTKWYHSCGCCDDSQSREQLKKHVTDILKPNHLPFQEMYVAITVLQ